MTVASFDDWLRDNRLLLETEAVISFFITYLDAYC